MSLALDAYLRWECELDHEDQEEIAILDALWYALNDDERDELNRRATEE